MLVSTVSAGSVAAFEEMEAAARLDWTVARFRVGVSGDFEDWAISGFDRAFLDEGAPALQEFDRGEYPNEAAVREAVRTNPNLAIADVSFLQRGLAGPPEGDVEVGDERQIKAPVTGKIGSRRVVAISAAGAAFSGAMVSKDSLGDVVDSPLGNRHYVAIPKGYDPDIVAEELQQAFLTNGLEARSFEQIVHEALRDQEEFFNLIEGYLALGLFIGVAGLGITMIRAVRERRHQIGVLRATPLGYLPP